MRLNKWKRKNKITNTRLAELVGVDQSFICHILAGRRRPSPEIALHIEEITGGEVTLKELLFPDLFPGQDDVPRKEALH